MATIKDVSKDTGFSVTTVSRALNGYTDVSEKTRKIIRASAEKLHYTPNILARTLVTKRSRTIGLLVNGLKKESVFDNFVFEILCGVSEYVDQYNYEMMLLNTTTSRQRNKNFLQLVQERNLDGVIIEGLSKDDPYLKEAVKSSIPTVLIDVPIENSTTGYVTSNQFDEVRNAVKYLIRLGHRKIAFMNGDERAYVSDVRLKAYRSALEEINLPYDESLVCNGLFNEDVAYQTALNFFLNYTDITAIFCASDRMAFGVLRAAHELGMKVPDDLSIIGFDNVLLAKFVEPPLSTVAQSPYKLGFAAASLLLTITSGTCTIKHVILENKLIIRQSTAKKKST